MIIQIIYIDQQYTLNLLIRIYKSCCLECISDKELPYYIANSLELEWLAFERFFEKYDVITGKSLDWSALDLDEDTLVQIMQDAAQKYIEEASQKECAEASEPTCVTPPTDSALVSSPEQKPLLNTSLKNKDLDSHQGLGKLKEYIHSRIMIF